MCWTFIVHYGMEQVGLSLAEAQSYNIVAMIIFLCSRWICTWLLRYFSPGANVDGVCFRSVCIHRRSDLSAGERSGYQSGH